MAKKIPSDTRTFHYHNENPKQKNTSDCVVRAIATATGIPWEEVLQGLTEIALKHKLMPNDKKCYGKYLEALGWKMEKQPRKEDGRKYTGKEFCELLDSEDCEYILSYKTSIDAVIVHIGGHHLACIKMEAGIHKVCDTWDSSNGCIGNYWTK